jgi:hypothetical protein
MGNKNTLLIIHKMNKDPKQYLDLWKWLSDDGAKVKDKM